MAPSFYIYLALLVPVALALAALLRLSPAAHLRHLALGTMAAALGALPAVIMTWSRGGEITAAQGWLRLDALSALHVLLLLVVFVPAACYAGRYFRVEIAEGEFSRKVARRFVALMVATEQQDPGPAAAPALRKSQAVDVFAQLWKGVVPEETWDGSGALCYEGTLGETVPCESGKYGGEICMCGSRIFWMWLY